MFGTGTAAVSISALSRCLTQAVAAGWLDGVEDGAHILTPKRNRISVQRQLGLGSRSQGPPEVGAMDRRGGDGGSHGHV